MTSIMHIPEEQMNTIVMLQDGNKKFKMQTEVFNIYKIDIFNGQDFIDNVLIP